MKKKMKVRVKLKNENVVDCVTILDCNYRYSDFYELDFLLLMFVLFSFIAFSNTDPNQLYTNLFYFFCCYNS